MASSQVRGSVCVDELVYVLNCTHVRATCARLFSLFSPLVEAYHHSCGPIWVCNTD